MLRQVKVFLSVFLLSLALGVGTTGCTPGVSGSCCRVCTTGKPCGDSCISRNSTCTKGSGCACYGSTEGPLLAGR